MAEDSKKTEQQDVANTEAQQSTIEASEQQKNPKEFLENFNWHKYEEGIDEVADEQLDQFEKLVEENFVDTLHNEVVQGKVIKITDLDAIIDINAKSEGVISLNEFRYNPRP